MDNIFISELRVETLIGIYAWERKVPQTIQLDLEVGLPGEHATKSGAIGDTIDYSKIVGRIEQLLHDRNFELLETAAEVIASMVIEEFDAPWVRLSIAKLGALRNVKKLGITIERGSRA